METIGAAGEVGTPKANCDWSSEVQTNLGQDAWVLGDSIQVVAPQELTHRLRFIFSVATTAESIAEARTRFRSLGPARIGFGRLKMGRVNVSRQ